MIRFCKKCGAAKPLSEFVRNAKCDHGRTHECLVCYRERAKHEMAKWRAANPEKVKATSASYYAKHKARLNEQSRKYQAANREKIREQTRRYKEANTDKLRAAKRRRVYGTDGTAEWTAQQGRCALCGVDLVTLPHARRHLDHCHATGTVRGWLCQGCNTALGKFRDDPARLRAAAAYLERGAS